MVSGLDARDPRRSRCGITRISEVLLGRSAGLIGVFAGVFGYGVIEVLVLAVDVENEGTMFPIGFAGLGGVLAITAGKPDEDKAHF